MPTKYITNKTSQLYESTTGRKRKIVLIFGDEVKTSGSPVNGCVSPEFREQDGCIDEDHLLYAARRAAASYWWESYEAIKPSVRT